MDMASKLLTFTFTFTCGSTATHLSVSTGRNVSDVRMRHWPSCSGSSPGAAGVVLSTATSASDGESKQAPCKLASDSLRGLHDCTAHARALCNTVQVCFEDQGAGQPSAAAHVWHGHRLRQPLRRRSCQRSSGPAVLEGFGVDPTTGSDGWRGVSVIVYAGAVQRRGAARQLICNMAWCGPPTPLYHGFSLRGGLNHGTPDTLRWFRGCSCQHQLNAERHMLVWAAVWTEASTTLCHNACQLSQCFQRQLSCL